MVPVTTAFAYALQLTDVARTLMALVSDAQLNRQSEISRAMFDSARASLQNSITQLDRAINLRHEYEAMAAETSKEI